MSHDRLNVTLTRTSNEFLAPRLPLDGEIELLEIGTHQHLIGATVFRELRPDGTLSAPVEVRDVAFTYTQPGALLAQNGAGPMTTPYVPTRDDFTVCGVERIIVQTGDRTPVLFSDVFPKGEATPLIPGQEDKIIAALRAARQRAERTGIDGVWDRGGGAAVYWHADTSPTVNGEPRSVTLSKITSIRDLISERLQDENRDRQVIAETALRMLTDLINDLKGGIDR